MGISEQLGNHCTAPNALVLLQNEGKEQIDIQETTPDVNNLNVFHWKKIITETYVFLMQQSIYCFHFIDLPV